MEVSTAVESGRVGIRGSERGRPVVDEADSVPAGFKVLVIDGNLLTAEAIALALGQARYSARFALPVTVDHVRDLASWGPRLALLDIDSVEAGTGVQCVELLTAAGVPVAVMAGPSAGPVLGHCLAAGAASVVDKSSQLNKLVGIIERVLAGDVVLTDEARQRLMEPYLREARARQRRLAPFDVLTEREKFVLSQLIEGFCADEIAKRNMVSISTVRSQIKAILQKLGVNSQLAVAALVRQAGWTWDAPDREHTQSR
jgi:DNA-binding NarL/FixJ family response regulator